LQKPQRDAPPKNVFVAIVPATRLRYKMKKFGLADGEEEQQASTTRP
jgi:hypothetical protein